jgi:hemoglobin-like flavoprotein
MTPEQVKLVHDSFAQVAPIGASVANLFYDRLFHIAPEVRPLFPDDLTGQKAKLMQMLALAAVNLHQVERIIPAVRELGRRHAGYGVTPGHYERVGAALLWALEQSLGPAFTPHIKDGWAAAYATIANAMKTAAAEVLIEVAEGTEFVHGHSRPSRSAGAR